MAAETVYRMLIVLIVITSAVLAILFVNAVAAEAERIRRNRNW